GVDVIFFAGTPLEKIVEFVRARYRRPGSPLSYAKSSGRLTDLHLSRLLTAAEAGFVPPSFAPHPSPLTIGITGPGGAGKTTLIDELTLRFLKAQPRSKLAILSHDPSLVGKGALLGDRASMVYAQDNRVFMRSLGTRGQSGGLSAASGRCV